MKNITILTKSELQDFNGGTTIPSDGIYTPYPWPFPFPFPFPGPGPTFPDPIIIF